MGNPPATSSNRFKLFQELLPSVLKYQWQHDSPPNITNRSRSNVMALPLKVSLTAWMVTKVRLIDPRKSEELNKNRSNGDKLPVEKQNISKRKQQKHTTGVKSERKIITRVSVGGLYRLHNGPLFPGCTFKFVIHKLLWQLANNPETLNPLDPMVGLSSPKHLVSYLTSSLFGILEEQKGTFAKPKIYDQNTGNAYELEDASETGNRRTMIRFIVALNLMNVMEKFSLKNLVIQPG
ncbi:hypothetical protein Tco_0347454 [Tanacetum coccineum]